MSAPQEVSSIKKIGIITGGGDLPRKVIAYCDEHDISVFLICFEGHTDKETAEGRESLWVGLGEAGKIMNTLKKNDVYDLVMAGKIKRPNLRSLKTDLKGAQIISRIGLKAMGDDGLLGALRKELEQEGFTLHGVEKFSEGLIAKSGPIGKYKPLEEDWSSIQHGFNIAQEIGRLDIGQSVIVQDGVIMGVEGAEGTDALIERCASLLKKERRAFLVKTCKPQQDKDMDLPTIGPDTIMQAYKSGLSGIIIHAENSIILDIKAIAKKADSYKIFVYGYNGKP
ncbi:MAG: UDP-2,3-diacylglucosamine diphosphatase LpxI [Alphaproteobacteria bacterium]|nr:UDP-2,3-diacylglucosamine diphosphatase LpxI [Alphaproteobacteria bacterium]